MNRLLESAAVSTEVARWTLASPFGAVRIDATERGIARIAFVGDGGSPNRTDELNNAAFLKAHPWARRALGLLEDYLAGQPVSFDGIPVDLSGLTPFRRRTLEACRRIRYGETTSYAGLARRLKNPAAARAVGSAMRHNPVAIIIPCHRVLGSDGGLGGYSAPGSLDLKRRLLEMERGDER